MCTAVVFQTKDHYFGRTFDWDISYGEKIVLTPRKFPLHFRKMPSFEAHYGILGMAVMAEGTPLYFDAINEKGIGMAGLNFPGNTVYREYEEGKDNLASFEFLPWILAQCATMEEVKRLLERVNLLSISFSPGLPTSPLHWIITDGSTSVTVECVKEGLKVYDNPVGVLTNNPPFPMQLFYLSQFQQLSKKAPVNRFADGLVLATCSRGMGALGLPGDLSSASRFVRAAFVCRNSLAGHGEEESISQFFHILGAVEQQRGCVELAEDVYEISIYTSCCNLDRGLYYYKTYDGHTISCVDMHREDLDAAECKCFELQREPVIRRQN